MSILINSFIITSTINWGDIFNLLSENLRENKILKGLYRPLKEKGVLEVFGPGTNLLNAIYKIFNLIKYGKQSNI